MVSVRPLVPHARGFPQLPGICSVRRHLNAVERNGQLLSTACIPIFQNAASSRVALRKVSVRLGSRPGPPRSAIRRFMVACASSYAQILSAAKVILLIGTNG